MGSAYTTIAADALSRFYKMAGASPIFVTGTDEHGEKIASAAGEADVQAFCDGVAEKFKELWQLLDVEYHHFVRTTDKQHMAVVADFMKRIWDNGDIYKSHYEGIYCTGCEEYKDTKELLPGNVCPNHQKPCKSRKEDNYFFALSKYQDRLETFLEDNPKFVLPRERRNEVLGWVRSGLRDFSVSRANNPWGIPIPSDHSQTIYVWFDALLGYLTPLLRHDPSLTLDDALKLGWPADTHIIGKDILRFHAVYWPAMLMSAGLPLPRRVIGHGFITKDGLKMGKSLGNTLDPFLLVDEYGSDAVRYFFLRGVDFGRDGDFSEQRFVDIVNADLANSLGNLINRSLNLLKKNCNAALPLSSSEIIDHSSEHQTLRDITETATTKAYQAYEKLNFAAACEAMMSITCHANAYIDRIAPWTKLKSEDPEDVLQAHICLVNVLEASRIAAAGLSPVVPRLSNKIYSALGMDTIDSWQLHMQWGMLTKGCSFEKPKPLFPRLQIALPEAAAVS